MASIGPAFSIALAMASMSTAADAQTIAKPVLDRLNATIRTYHSCVWEEFKAKAGTLTAGEGDRELIFKTTTSCEPKLDAVRTALKAIPGATDARLNEMVEKTRRLAVRELLALMAALILEKEGQTAEQSK